MCTSMPLQEPFWVLWKPPIYSVALTCSQQCTGLRNDTLVCAGTPHILRRRMRENGAGQLWATALRKRDTPYTWPSSNSLSSGEETHTGAQFLPVARPPSGITTLIRVRPVRLGAAVVWLCLWHTLSQGLRRCIGCPGLPPS
jgi:hypothetical protein